MAKKKKKDSKSKARRESLKSFARKGSDIYPQKYQTDKELVYGNGRNYTVGVDFPNANAGAIAANAVGKSFIYLDGILRTTAGGIAKNANSTHTKNAGAETLDLSIA